jgi:hypothetical protein
MMSLHGLQTTIFTTLITAVINDFDPEVENDHGVRRSLTTCARVIAAIPTLSMTSTGANLVGVLRGAVISALLVWMR